MCVSVQHYIVTSIVCVSARQNLSNPESFLCATATEDFIILAVRASARENRISQPHVCEFERRLCVCVCVCVCLCVCVCNVVSSVGLCVRACK